MLEKCPHCRNQVLFTSNICPGCQNDRTQKWKFIKFECPWCRQHIEASSAGVGSVIACPTCSGEFQMPQEQPRHQRLSHRSQDSSLTKVDISGRSGTRFYLGQPGARDFLGPFTIAEMASQFRSGQLDGTTLATEARGQTYRQLMNTPINQWTSLGELCGKVSVGAAPTASAYASVPPKSRLEQLLHKPLWGSNSALREEAIKNMGFGALWFIGGSLVTFITYTAASAEGGHYVVAYGAIAVGAFQFLAGLFQWFRS